MPASSPFLDIPILLFVGIGVVFYVRRTMRRVSNSLARMESRFDEFATTVGHLRNITAAQFETLGTEIGLLRNNADAQFETLGTATGLLRNNTDARFETLGTEIGLLRNNADAQFETLGTAIGLLRNNAAARFEALGTAGGYLANRVEQLSDLSTSLILSIRGTIQALNHDVAAWKFSLGLKCDPNNIVPTRLANFVCVEPQSKTPAVISGDRRRPAVIITLGQSTAGNHGLGLYKARNRVYNFSPDDGCCYHATDPLLGASGAGANFATRLGDMLIGQKLFDRVIIAPIA